MKVQIKAVSPKIGTEFPAPFYASGGAAGMDLCACTDGPVTLRPGCPVTVPTGVAIALPGPEYAALVFGRSGLGFKHGVSPSNGVGVVDSDYRGEIKVSLCNSGRESYTVQPGERIAQLVIVPVARAELEWCCQLPETERGESGFGSTGK